MPRSSPRAGERRALLPATDAGAYRALLRRAFDRADRPVRRTAGARSGRPGSGSRATAASPTTRGRASSTCGTGSRSSRRGSRRLLLAVVVADVRRPLHEHPHRIAAADPPGHDADPVSRAVPTGTRARCCYGSTWTVRLISVMSRMRRIDGDVQTSSNRAPRSCIRCADARITPSAVESRNVTPLASSRRIVADRRLGGLERAAERVGRVDVQLALNVDDGGRLVDDRLGERRAGRVPLHTRDVTRSERSTNPLALRAPRQREAVPADDGRGRRNGRASRNPKRISTRGSATRRSLTGRSFAAAAGGNGSAEPAGEGDRRARPRPDRVRRASRLSGARRPRARRGRQERVDAGAGDLDLDRARQRAKLDLELAPRA